MFRDCTWQTAPLGDGLLFIGISTAEIHNAILLHRLPRREWPEILYGIQQIMVPAARAELNRQSHR